MNCQFMRYNPLCDKPSRAIKENSGRQAYRFYYQILNGFELAGAIPQEKLNTKVELQIGTSNSKKITTDKARGRYPLWNKFDHKDVLMEKELTLESDMKISVYNE